VTNIVELTTNLLPAESRQVCSCLSKKPCGVNGCTRNHHQMLHQDEKQSGSIHNTNVPASQVFLELYRSKSWQRLLRIHSLYVTTTLIDASFAEGPELPFCCRWMNKNTKNYEKSKKVLFKIAVVGSELEWHVVSGARTISNLDLPRQTIDKDFLMGKYPYLPKDVEEKDVSITPRV
jgi:hypothetical protein